MCVLILPLPSPLCPARSLTSLRLPRSASNLPNSLHHALVTHLSSPRYSHTALLDKIDLLCSFLSYRIGRCIDSDDLGAYADDWMVRSSARVGSLLCASPSRSPCFIALEAALTRPCRAARSRRQRQDAARAALDVLRHAHRLARRACAHPGLSGLGGADRVRPRLAQSSPPGRPLLTASPTSRRHFSLCQYPFLLSLGAKLTLLAFDGERQMVRPRLPLSPTPSSTLTC